MPRARRAGTPPAAGGGETAAALGGVPGGEAIPSGTTQRKKLSEAVNRRLKSALGVQNLTMSDGFQYQEQLDNITKAEIAARAMLMHHGYGANEADLAAAGETLGLAVAELLRDGYGKEAKMDWKALALITGMTIVVVASAKNMCYPAEATVDRETTMFLARGVEDQFYVVLNPLRAQTGSAEEYVDNLLIKWDDEAKKRKVVHLESSDEERPLEQTPGAAKRRVRGKVGGAAVVYKEAETSFPRFEVNEAHEVLEDWEGYTNFIVGMRKIRVMEPIIWVEFIGEKLLRRVEMLFRLQFKSEFNATRMPKGLFLERIEILKNLDTSKPSKRTGEPHLYAEPGAVKTFIEDFFEFRSQNSARYTNLEWCERLIYRISQNRRDWAREVEGTIGILKTEQFAEAGFLTICRKLEILEREEVEKAKTLKEAARHSDNPSHERFPSQRRNYEAKRGQQEYQQNSSWQPQWPPTQNYQPSPFGGQTNQAYQPGFGGQANQGYQTGQVTPYAGFGPPPLSGSGYQSNHPRPENSMGGLPLKSIVSFKCYNCDDPTHSSRECTKPKRCNTCHSLSHLAMRCDGSGPKGAVGGPPPPGLGQSTVATATDQSGKQYVPMVFNTGPSKATVGPSATGGEKGNK